MIEIRINGQPHVVAEGISVAVALIEADAARTSVTGERREAHCGMGICFECRATVDGVFGVRTCMIDVATGMEIRTDD